MMGNYARSGCFNKLNIQAPLLDEASGPLAVRSGAVGLEVTVLTASLAPRGARRLSSFWGLSRRMKWFAGVEGSEIRRELLFFYV